jgi:Zn-dependent protease with chaperone function
MSYSNPQLPEGINAGHDNPAKEFFVLGGGLLAVITVLCLLLFGAAQILAPHIPFEWERKLAGSLDDRLAVSAEAAETGTEARLQTLADRLGAVMGLPDGMSVRVHYVDDGNTDDGTAGTVNAFATLGGNIFYFAGLLELLPDENAIAMVMAHEIAHVKHRDVISGVSGGILVSAALGLVLGDPSAFATIGEMTAALSALSYGRKREESADAAAQAALVELYGHSGGFKDLFDILQRTRGAVLEAPEFLSSHPDSARRIENLVDLARSRNWPLDGPRKAWP